MDLYNLVISAKLFKGEGGGGGDVDVESLSVTENGTYAAPSGKAYSPVTVSVPASGITPTGTKAISANGVYDVTDFASVDVDVSTGGGGDHDAEDALIMKTISGAYTNSRVTSIGTSAFYDCKELASVSFPNVTNIRSYAFASCSKLASVSFPNVTNIGSFAFASCSKLASVSFPNVTNIGSWAFYDCKELASVNILASSVVYLSSTNAFSSTPISRSTYTGSFGSIYVPASLVDIYKTADKWSYYADRITAYEGE